MTKSMFQLVKVANRVVDGVHVTTFGSNSAHQHQHGSKPYVLILHGWMGSSQDLIKIATEIAYSEHHVIIVDLPYHAQSIGCEPDTIIDAAEVLTKVVVSILPTFHKSLSCSTPISVIGYSLGGRIALEMSHLLSQPNTNFSICIQSLILISCAPPPASAAERTKCREISQNIAETVSVISTSEAFETWLRCSWYTNSMWGDLRKVTAFDSLILSRRLAFTKHQREAWATAAIKLDRVFMTTDLVTHKTPVLYICGTDDCKYVNFESRFRHIFGNALQSRFIPNAGHNILLQKPDEVTKEITSFLGETQARALDEKAKTTVLRTVVTKDYCIDLTNPISVNGVSVSQRRGFLVCIVSDDNLVGIGDVCPLPGLHSVQLSQCRNEVNQLATSLKNEGYIFRAEAYDLDALDTFTYGMSSVTRNAVECATIHLISSALEERLECVVKNIMLTQLRNRGNNKPGEIVRVNGVLPRTNIAEERNFKQTSQQSAYTRCVYNSPFETVKLKVGALSDIRMDAHLVLEALQACKLRNKALRLDANRAWTPTQFRTFQETLGHQGSSVQYIEEPVRTVSDLKDVVSTDWQSETSCRIPIALDETLAECDENDISCLAERCSAFVIKPAVVGSLHSFTQLVDIALNTKCTVIISTVFESGVGIAWNAILASVCDSFSSTFIGRPPCHGLGTFSYLRGDALDSHFSSFCVQSEGSSVNIRLCERFLSECARSIIDKAKT